MDIRWANCSVSDDVFKDQYAFKVRIGIAIETGGRLFDMRPHGNFRLNVRQVCLIKGYDQCAYGEDYADYSENPIQY